MIVARGPNVFAGYVDARMNAGTLSAGGWVLTGDLGHMDAEGYIFVTGRAIDLIIRGSHNIDPIDVESAAAACPAVLQCAAVAQPDSYAGEVPVLYVTLKPSATMNAEEILQFVGERVSEGPARPWQVFIVDELPTTPVGKVFKPALRRDAAQRVVCTELNRQDIAATVTMVEDPRCRSQMRTTTKVLVTSSIRPHSPSTMTTSSMRIGCVSASCSPASRFATAGRVASPTTMPASPADASRLAPTFSIPGIFISASAPARTTITSVAERLGTTAWVCI